MSDQITVLIITARADFGGGPQHIHLLLNELRENVRFIIACPKDDPYWERFSKISSEMIEIPHRKVKISTLRKLRSKIESGSIDIIHSHGKGAGIYGRMLSAITGVPCIHTFHGLHIQQYGSLKKWIYLKLERILSRSTLKIISVSKSEKKRLIENKVANTDKIVVIENGIQIPGQQISEANHSQNPIRILAVTRLDYAKNPEFLLDIAKALIAAGADSFIIDVIGSGFDDSDFSNKLNELEKYFCFIGTVLNVSEYYYRSFCFISTSRWEGLPLAILESMSIGLPVIASNVPGNSDLINDSENGFLYKAFDAKEAAERILLLKNDMLLWQKISRTSADFVNTGFSATVMAKKIQTLYMNAANTVNK